MVSSSERNLPRCVPRRYVVAPASEMPPGSRRVVIAGGRSIGVFNVQGRFYALRNACPHQGAALCIGPIGGTTEADRPHHLRVVHEGRILRCPWHAWEFDITTGGSVFRPDGVRVKTFDVERGAVAQDDVQLESFDVSVEESFVILYA